MSKALQYRPEIDGLRAVAVLAVVLFHLNPRWLKGGFLGVDVFFVISGFLITTIVQRELQAGQFSIIEFWRRRVRRLYPALCVMVAAVSLAGYVFLINPERTELIMQAVAAMVSFENILLWRTTGGYWDTSSENIALLHAWTLSLEEQYYIVFPPLLMLLYGYARKLLFWFVGGLAVASLALCCLLTPEHRTAAFYLLPTRMWELLIGSCLAIYMLDIKPKAPSPWVAQVAVGVGLLAIILSFVFIGDEQQFPSAWPLIPCLGAALIIGLGQSAGPLNWFLTRLPLVYVGKISYSLYLWHWPVIVFYRYSQPSGGLTWIVLLTAGLSVLSYHLVENPCRQRFRRIGPMLIGITTITALALTPIILFRSPPMLPETLAGLDDPRSLTRGWEFESTPNLLDNGIGIQVGRTDAPAMLVLTGSSHARMFAAGLTEYVQQQGWSARVMATSGMSIVSDGSELQSKINAQRIVATAQVAPRLTIVSDRWETAQHRPEFDQKLRATLAAFANSSDHVIVLSQIPRIDLPPGFGESVRKYILSIRFKGHSIQATPLPAVVHANSRVREIVESMNNPKIEFLDIYSPMINPDGSVRLTDGSQFLYSDDDHINDLGASWLFNRHLIPAIERKLGIASGKSK